MTNKTRSAIEKYGLETCKEAFAESQAGNGASTISWEVMPDKYTGKTRSADAAINAGRELAGI